MKHPFTFLTRDSLKVSSFFRVPSHRRLRLYVRQSKEQGKLRVLASHNIWLQFCFSFHIFFSLSSYLGTWRHFWKTLKRSDELLFFTFVTTFCLKLTKTYVIFLCPQISGPRTVRVCSDSNHFSRSTSRNVRFAEKDHSNPPTREKGNQIMTSYSVPLSSHAC